MRGNADRLHYGYASAATLPGLLYGARSVGALGAGRLDHMAHGGSGLPVLVVIVNLFLLALLLGMGRIALAQRAAPGFCLAAGGLVWSIGAHAGEALQIPAPWGLYGSPGLVATVAGLLWIGLKFATTAGTRDLGRLLAAAALLRLGGGAVSLLLFNLLGRETMANWIATITGRSLHLMEAICWILLGLALVRRRDVPLPICARKMSA